MVNGGGRQRGRQHWPRKTWEGKGLTAPPLHLLLFVITMSPGWLGLTLTIDSKGLARQQQRGPRRGEKRGKGWECGGQRHRDDGKDGQHRHRHLIHLRNKDGVMVVVAV